MILYPDGYRSEMIPLAEMRARHEAKMHPEFARRFFAYMEHRAGTLGVGGGWRLRQPDKPGAAPDGKSFHQTQTFPSCRGYAAVDLVVPVPGKAHRAPTWAETEDAPAYGLHTFIRTPIEEPWHLQPKELRGWQTWANAGRPDLLRFTLPTEPTEEDDMQPYIAIPPPERYGLEWIVVSAGGVRPATTFDLQDGIPQRKMENIPGTNPVTKKPNRVEQYDALRKAAGLV